MARRPDDPLGDRPDGTFAEMTGAFVEACYKVLKSRSRHRRPKAQNNMRRPSEYGLLSEVDADFEDEADIPLVQAAGRSHSPV